MSVYTPGPSLHVPNTYHAYELSFTGRPVGAIGAVYSNKSVRWARSLADATRLLYEPLPVAFEHITGVQVVSISCLHQNVQIDAAFEQVRAAISKAEGRA